MKVTATTLPCSSCRESRWPSCVVRVNSGAGPIRGRPSRAPAASPGVGNSQPPAVRTMSMPTHHLGRMCTSTFSYPGRVPLLLQFLFQLVEEAPVGALGDDLLRTALDHPHFVEPQGVEADGVFRVVLAPARIGNLPEGLRCI